MQMLHSDPKDNNNLLTTHTHKRKKKRNKMRKILEEC